MAEVIPQTTIKLCKNVPLDTTYDNTIYFANRQTQYNYFNSLVSDTFSAQYYQRVNRNVLRIQKRADSLYRCNYLMFSNDGTQWFYCFIKRVDYVNENCSEVEYELDVMQTWFFDFTLEECFVEREHTSTDLFAGNIVEENLDFGEILIKDTVYSTNYQPLVPAVFGTVDKEGQKVGEDEGEVNYPLGVQISKNVMAGLLYAFYDGEGNPSPTKLSNFFKKVSTNGTIDGVGAVYMIPKKYIDWTEADTGIRSSKDSYYNLQVSDIFGTLDGYTPKNNKLYTYPYNFLRVVSSSGETNTYRYEFFISGASGSVTFHEYCTITPNPQGLTVPSGYKSGSSSGVENMGEAVKISYFPLCSYSYDTYKAWLAQNQNQLNTTLNNQFIRGLVGTGISATYGALTGDYLGATAGLVKNSMNLVSTVNDINALKKDRAVAPDTTKSVSGDIMNMRNETGFRYEKCCITYEYARIIDNYFTLFGYAVRRLKVPNINVRPYWTYCKTVGCNIRGSIPADDAKKICEIFDHGVTHWTNGANIGNYSLNNAPA